MDFQKNIVAYLRNKTKEKTQLAQELSDILNISQESVYRRLRYETSFTAEELSLLAKNYTFSLDELLPNLPENRISVGFQSIFTQNNVFEGYLKGVINAVKRIHSEKGSITYMARDLPISQSFQHQILREFKLFYWTKVVLNRPTMHHIVFDDQIQLGKINGSIDLLLEAYKKTARIEFWSEDTLNSTLRQINYCNAMNLFKEKEFCFAVVDSLSDLLNRLESSLEQQKNEESSFQFYLSHVELSNNYVFLKHQNSRLVYLNFNTFNSLASSNFRFCDEVELMITQARAKSLLISGQSAIERKKYFNAMRLKVQDFKNQLN
jgi:hypothetical protein